MPIGLIVFLIILALVIILTLAKAIIIIRQAEKGSLRDSADTRKPWTLV